MGRRSYNRARLPAWRHARNGCAAHHPDQHHCPSHLLLCLAALPELKCCVLCNISPVAFSGLVFTLRPQLLGYIFLLVTLILLERFRQGEQKTLWLLPPIFLLWVNSHGTFVLGFMVLGLYWLSGLIDFDSGGLYAVRWRPEQRLHMEVVGLLSVAVLPLTPYGTRPAAVPLEVADCTAAQFSRHRRMATPNTDFWQAKLLLVLLFAFIVAQLAFTACATDLKSLRYFSIVRIRRIRTFPLCRSCYAIVFAPLAASSVCPLGACLQSHGSISTSVNAVTHVCSSGGHGVCSSLPSPSFRKTSQRNYPVQAVRYIQATSHSGPNVQRLHFRWLSGLGRGAPDSRSLLTAGANIYEHAGVFLPRGCRISMV